MIMSKYRHIQLETFKCSFNCTLEVMVAQGTFYCYYFKEQFGGFIQSQYTIYDTDGTTVLYTLGPTTNSTYLPGTLSAGQYVEVSGGGNTTQFIFSDPPQGFTGLTVEQISRKKVKVLTVSDGFSIMASPG